MYRLVTLLAICFSAFILWIIYLANTGGNSIFFDLVRSIPNGDKFGHAGLFGFLTLIIIIASKYRSFKLGKLNIYYGVIVVIPFIIGEELSQAFIASRTFDFVDIVADFIGVGIAIGFAFLASKYLTKSSSDIT